MADSKEAREQRGNAAFAGMATGAALLGVFGVIGYFMNRKKKPVVTSSSSAP